MNSVIAPLLFEAPGKNSQAFHHGDQRQSNLAEGLNTHDRIASKSLFFQKDEVILFAYL